MCLILKLFSNNFLLIFVLKFLYIDCYKTKTITKNERSKLSQEKPLQISLHNFTSALWTSKTYKLNSRMRINSDLFYEIYLLQQFFQAILLSWTSKTLDIHSGLLHIHLRIHLITPVRLLLWLAQRVRQIQLTAHKCRI